uniref:Uncharacterized protein n=1 Tax=Tetranychus urticae TaxID=32264 RepID=T1JUL2_TETUR
MFQLILKLSLSGKLTGSSQCIGEVNAIHFAKLGASVGITGRNKERVNKDVGACQFHSFNGAKVKYFLRVSYYPWSGWSNDDFCRVLIDTIEQLGRLDVLVNNAGICKMALTWLTETAMLSKGIEDLMPLIRKRVAETYPLGRIGESEDVSNAIVFLASDMASFISGSCLPVDGGSLDGSYTHTPPDIMKMICK